MEDPNDESLIIAQLISFKPAPKTAHQLLRPPSIEGSLKNISNLPIDQIKQQSRPKSKSKQQTNEQKIEKAYSKCVRIMLSNKSIGSKSYSCQNISSFDGRVEGECSLDQIDLGSKQKPALETLTSQNIKKSAIMKKQSKKIKSYRDLNAGGNLSLIKSSKSIKFSDKKDVFTYKDDNKKQGAKKKTKSFHKSSNLVGGESQQCCQLI